MTKEQKKFSISSNNACITEVIHSPASIKMLGSLGNMYISISQLDESNSLKGDPTVRVY
jgi:hypothetical protein